MTGPCRPTPPRGFTLVELVVALLLLQLMLLGALASMRLGAYRANRAHVLERALWEVGALADSTRAGWTDGMGARPRPWGWMEWQGTRIEARDSTGRLLVSLEVGP